MKNLLTLLGILLCFNCKAQIVENFDDTIFKSKPIWLGDTVKFKIIDGKLQSKSNVIYDKFQLSTLSNRLENTEWNFWLNLQFSTQSGRLSALAEFS